MSVLREDPRLFAFPAVSAAISVGVGAAAFAISATAAGGSGHTRRVLLLAGILASYPVTFATLFCGVALAAMLARRLNGEPATRSVGWAAAKERLGVIAAWTLLVCTVGALLRTLEQYVPLGGKIVAWVADISWSLATLFAVPVLAYEGLGPIATFRRSASLFKQRWVEQTLGNVGIGVLSGFFSVPFVLLIVAGVAMANGTGVVVAAVGGAGFLGVTAVQVALDQVFRVFVYRNALGLDPGEAGPFPRADLERPFTPRKGLFGTG
jgi:hypothetical protein